MFQDGLISDWGFSCLVETAETKLLFDTGANGNILLKNMSELKIDPRKIDAVVLSHDHWDHTGGLRTLLDIVPTLTVYRPTFSSKPQKIMENIMTTGALERGGLKEQALIGVTEQGVIVITGCSHPGLENLLESASKYGKIHAVVGGFHGFDKFNALKGIPLICPCHCTAHKHEIKKRFPNACTECGVGKVIDI